MRTTLLAVAFGLMTSIAATGCLDNDQDTDNTQEKQDPDQDDGPVNQTGVGDPGTTQSTNPAVHDDDRWANQLDPQQSPTETCHERSRGDHRCE